MKPYKYRTRPIARPEYTTENVLRIGNQETLTGIVSGMKASDLEERVARALSRLEASFDFRIRITSDALGDRELTKRFENVRGEVEIDFLAQRGQVYPIFVDGQISHHYAPWQADQDKAKTDVTNEFGRKFGWHEAIRIPFWELVDQDMANRTVRRVLS
jgi:hypothetical protein